MKTQKQIILEILKDKKWHSVREFIKAYIPRYGAVLDRIKKDYVLKKRDEKIKKHMKDRRTIPQEEWKLIKKI